MAQGQYSFQGKRPQAPMKFDPVPKGVYNATLRTTSSEVKASQNPGKAARVSCRWELPELTSANGKPRLLFHDFHLSLKAGKDGFIMAERADGLLALATALDRELPDFDTVEVASEDGESTFQALNAQQALDWLKELDGETVRLDVGIQGARTFEGKEYDASNKIKAIMPAEGEMVYDGDEQAPDEEEEKPAPKKVAAKPTSKMNGHSKKK